MESIGNILICGTGMVGRNIALVFSANPEHRITLYGIFPTDVKEGIRTNTRQLVEKEILTEEALTERFLRISLTSDLDGQEVRTADPVIKAVFEDMKAKQDTFEVLEGRLSGDAVFCTNSSVMSPSEISSRLRYREWFVGTHFRDPAHLIPLVEAVMFDATSNDAIRTMVEVLASVEKRPVLCRKDISSFIVNRMQHALWREAVFIMERGITDTGTVDEVVRYPFGLRLPQLGLIENAGMVETNLAFNIHDCILADLGDSYQPSAILRQLKEDGKLGFKTGEGFQTQSEEQKTRSTVNLNQYLIRMIYGEQETYSIARFQPARRSQ